MDTEKHQQNIFIRKSEREAYRRRLTIWRELANREHLKNSLDPWMRISPRLAMALFDIALHHLDQFELSLDTGDELAQVLASQTAAHKPGTPQE